MRKLYIDNIRWVTVVLVVLYHVIYMFNGIETFGVIGSFSDVQYQDAFQYIVYPWFMLLLFVVSGMSARYELDHRSEKEFIKNRTRKLLIPSTLGLLVFWWILGYYNLLIGGGLEQMTAVLKPVLFIIMAVSGIGPLWYIQMLWIFSGLLVWVRRVEKDSHDRVMDRLEKCWLPLAVCAVILAVVFTVMYWGRPYAEHSVLDTPLCNLFAWIATIAVLAFMKKWGNISNTFTRWMAAKSWGLYLFHYLFIVIPAKARKIFDIKPGDNLIVLGDEGQGIALIQEKGLLDLLKAAREEH